MTQTLRPLSPAVRVHRVAARSLACVAVLLCALAVCIPCVGAARAWADEGAVTVIDSSGARLEASGADTSADKSVSVSKDADAATASGCSFGIDGFTRYNKGTNKEVDGASIGYRYPMGGEDAFVVMTTDEALLVYVPASSADALGIDVADSGFQGEFLAMYAALDKAGSMGGQTYERLKLPVYYTSSDTVSMGDYTYRFAVQAGDGWYAAISKAGSDDAGDGGLYCSTGTLSPSGDVTVVEQAQGLDALAEFFAELDWSPLWVSLRTTGVAILVIFVLGLLAAWLTLRVSNRLKGVLDTVFTIPMVLPPTVCGFLLLMLFGNQSPTGKFFIEHLHLDLVFTWPAAVIACIVVGFPMMYRTVRGAFENIDANMLDAARTLGWGEGRIFLRIMLPLAWPSIAAGTVLAFARAMGEFGCTLFFAGNYAGITQTIPLAIYFDWMGGKPDVALFWVIVVILISFLVILFINIYSSRTQRYRRRLGE